jgi:uncharacterized protein YeaO (DUF488 family)
MVAPAFGYSIGDCIALGRLVIDIREAFKEAGGASTKYASETLFLRAFQNTLKRLEEYAAPATDDGRLHIQDITELQKLIAEPLKEFDSFLGKYRESLAQNNTKSKLKKVWKTISFTLKNLSEKVEKLRVRIEQPLHAINAPLSLETIEAHDIVRDQEHSAD